MSEIVSAGTDVLDTSYNLTNTKFSEKGK